MSIAVGYSTLTGYTNLSTYTPAPLKEISSNEVLAKIKNGTDVEYSHVIIKGDLDLSQLGLPIGFIDRRDNRYSWGGDTGWGDSIGRDVAIIFSKISIEDSLIEGNIDIGYAFFMKPVKFQSTRFNDTVSIQFSDFIEEANFKKCQFNKDTYIISCVFNRDASFEEADFNERTTFRDSQFKNNADFALSNFDGPADFSESIFDEISDFHSANFNERLDFSGCQFNNEAYFGYSGPPLKTIGDAIGSGYTYDVGSYISDFAPWGTGMSGYGYGLNFGGITDFSHSDFRDIVDFSGRQFKQSANLESIIFNGFVSFNQTTFVSDSYFSSSIFKKGVDFNMSQFRGNTSFEGAEFFGFIDLTKTTFSKLDLYWPSDTRLICNDGLTYLNLIKNFRDLEHFELADDVYYMYRQWRQDRTSWLDANKYLDLLAWLSCGYGVRPGYPLYWSVFLIFAFGIIYWKFEGIHKSNKQYYTVTYASGYKDSRNLTFTNCLDVLMKIRERSSTNPSLSFSDAFYFSSMIFFVSHPPTDWRPSDRYVGWKYVIMIEDILGWLLLTLFVVTLTRVMIRP